VQQMPRICLIYFKRKCLYCSLSQIFLLLHLPSLDLSVIAALDEDALFPRVSRNAVDVLRVSGMHLADKIAGADTILVLAQPERIKQKANV
jgi:hypothetical protein